MDYCSIYRSSVCTVCITGYFLSNNTCIQQSQECQATDSNGLCTQCQTGFSVNEGLCVQNPVITNCTSSQYKDANGTCVDGNITNCVSYASPSGQCSACISGYTVNDQNQCVFTCPPATATQKFILRNGACVATDINC